MEIMTAADARKRGYNLDTTKSGRVWASNRTETVRIFTGLEEQLIELIKDIYQNKITEDIEGKLGRIIRHS
jgi:hypothetical protein